MKRNFASFYDFSFIPSALIVSLSAAKALCIAVISMRGFALQSLNAWALRREPFADAKGSASSG
jgi:hypothetical protein